MTSYISPSAQAPCRFQLLPLSFLLLDEEERRTGHLKGREERDTITSSQLRGAIFNGSNIYSHDHLKTMGFSGVTIYRYV